MEIKLLADGFSVTGQVTELEMAEVAAAGFKLIICNRPDGEAMFQPPFAAVAKAASGHGLQPRHVPVA